MLKNNKLSLIFTVVSVFVLPVAQAQESPESAALESRYEIEREKSRLRVLVYRGGLLGGLGHNHVVSNGDLTGWAMHDPVSQSVSFSLALKVADFVIDDPAARAAEGDDFPGEMSPKDIAGTRKNMLGRKLLDADNHDQIIVRSGKTSGEFPDITFDVTVTLKGQEYPLSVPATVQLSESGFVAEGELGISHRDIGLKPFRAAFGALRVADRLVLKFELHGR